MDNSSITQRRFDFCKDLGNLLNVYIFNEEITSEITLNASKSAVEIKKTYDQLVAENNRLKQQLASIQRQATIITQNQYYRQRIIFDVNSNKKRKHLSVIEKAKNEQKYVCCDICDRFITKYNKTHTQTDVCLSIRVSKEMSRKEKNNILYKKNKRELIVAFRNCLIIVMTHDKLRQKKTDFENRIEKMNRLLSPFLKTA
tara:strand:- start:654 stop:1253 length:600 start_codon:yes stop_codon:yes gene_type:complete